MANGSYSEFKTKEKLMNAIIHLSKQESVDRSWMEGTLGGFSVEQVETDTVLTYVENNTTYLHWRHFYKQSSMEDLLIEVMSKESNERSYYFDAELKLLKSFSSTVTRFGLKKSLLEMGEDGLRKIMREGNVKNSESLEIRYLLLVDTKKNIRTMISHDSLAEYFI